MIDWTFELFFPPDLNYLDLKKTQKIARIHVEPGDIIFRQGERSHAFYVVEEGTLEAVRCNADGQVLWRDELIPGDHFGEGSLLYGIVRRVTVTAKTAATLMVFNSKEFKAFVGSFQSLSQLLSYTGRRGPQEEVLSENKWSTDLLTSSVETIMTHEVSCISESSTINEAVLALVNSQQMLLPIVNAEGKLTGIVTKTDVYRAMTLGQEFSDSVGAIATQKVAVLHQDQSVREALRVLYLQNVKQAPVLNTQERPVGILGYTDIAAARIRLNHASHEERSMASDSSKSSQSE